MSRPVKIIGLSGKKRSGKDTVYGMIADHALALRLAFADSLKEELAWACNVSTDFIEEHKESFRLGLQWWGTEFRRGLCGDEYWVKKMKNLIEEETRLLCQFGEGGKPVFIVITDVRFPNECTFIRNLGGINVRIVRGATRSADQHPSETALDDFKFDYVIDNNLGLKELEECVVRFLADISK